MGTIVCRFVDSFRVHSWQHKLTHRFLLIWVQNCCPVVICACRETSETVVYSFKCVLPISFDRIGLPVSNFSDEHLEAARFPINHCVQSQNSWSFGNWYACKFFITGATNRVHVSKWPRHSIITNNLKYLGMRKNIRVFLIDVCGKISMAIDCSPVFNTLTRSGVAPQRHHCCTATQLLALLKVSLKNIISFHGNITGPGIMIHAPKLPAPKQNSSESIWNFLHFVLHL